ncbi:MAG TPA: PQQ-binding-like beta-propeller repeat protein [Methylomirabilota bacterium]|nr:PQQ-binding-like beta-propeller repeat protein [Methylomirabilota bacterium]
MNSFHSTPGQETSTSSASRFRLDSTARVDWKVARSSPRPGSLPWRLLLVLCGLSVPAMAANWPTWRGPDADGITSEKNLPVEWSRTENVRWRVSLPEPGNSTPIVWGDQVFVTQNIGNERSLLCLDRRDGGELWRRGVTVTGQERTHETNPYCAASPVTDGERVVSWFGSGGLVAHDLSGNELWRVDLGRHDHQFGYGGSPVLHGDVCILNFGPGAREFVVAVNKRSGEEVWRVSSSTPGEDDIYGMWSTPFVARTDGRSEVVVALRDYFAGLDPQTGEELWRCDGLGIQAKSSPVAGGGVVVMSGDMRSAELAVRLGGSGNITETHRLWTRTPAKRRVGTGVIHDGHLYSVQTGGIADCVDLKTGEYVWEERLRGPSANNAVWSSPVLSDGHLYVLNQSGDTFVYRAKPAFEQVGVNSLGERSNSSVVVSDGNLFLRTHEALWCIGL